MPQQPWWENLEANFHKFPDDFYLDLRTQLLVESTAWLDLALRTAAATFVGLTAIPGTLRPRKLREDLADIAFYLDRLDPDDPGRFFESPRRMPVVLSSPARMGLFQPTGGSRVLLRFESPFVPVNPRLRKRFARFRRNRIAHAEYWRHDTGPRPTICVIHGFMADPYWINSRFLALPWFFKKGYDILLYTLPFHGARQERTSLFSGHGYFSGGVAQINETVAQSIHDFRIFLHHLFELGAPAVGVTGISLGGYTTALLAAVEERLAFAIPNVPVVSLVDLVFQWFPAGTLVKVLLRLGDISVVEARRAMAVHCPLTYPPRLPRERLMIIGGAGDRLAPPKHARILWDHWDRCRIHWFPGNHVLHLDQGKYLKEMRRFMEGIGFVP
ncbi:MAG: alpha/beta hydrolase [Deltaproteobacteria bacterium]|nr:MAG: alpha/beta hydrolase [Deltaproteobacteria bacterium]